MKRDPVVPFDNAPTLSVNLECESKDQKKSPHSETEWRPSWPIPTTPHEQCDSRKLEYISKRVKPRRIFPGFPDSYFLIPTSSTSKVNSASGGIAPG